MLNKILDEIKEIFGGMTKWVMLGILAFIAIIAIILFIFVINNLKLILIGSVIAIALVIVGVIIYKKVTKK